MRWVEVMVMVFEWMEVVMGWMEVKVVMGWFGWR